MHFQNQRTGETTCCIHEKSFRPHRPVRCVGQLEKTATSRADGVGQLGKSDSRRAARGLSEGKVGKSAMHTIGPIAPRRGIAGRRRQGASMGRRTSMGRRERLRRRARHAPRDAHGAKGRAWEKGRAGREALVIGAHGPRVARKTGEERASIRIGDRSAHRLLEPPSYAWKVGAMVLAAHRVMGAQRRSACPRPPVPKRANS